MAFRYRKISLLKSALQCAVYIFLLACFAKAQYRFDSWTTDNGLPQNSIYSILQTPDGYIWLTTLDGLVRFDGVRFTVFNKSNQKNLPSNRFVKLFAEADGTLWICTEESGLVRFSGGEFQIFTTADGLSSNYVYEIQKDTDGSLLIFTQNGIVRFRDNRFSIEGQRDFRDYKIYVAPSGVFWEMDKNGLRAIGKDGRETRYDLPFDIQKLSPDPAYNRVFYVNMFEDGEGALWFSATGNLYRVLHEKSVVLHGKIVWNYCIFRFFFSRYSPLISLIIENKGNFRKFPKGRDFRKWKPNKNCEE